MILYVSQAPRLTADWLRADLLRRGYVFLLEPAIGVIAADCDEDFTRVVLNQDELDLARSRITDHIYDGGLCQAIRGYCEENGGDGRRRDAM